MPTRPKRPCNHPGCSELVDKGYCEKHKPIRTYDKYRGTSTERGYGTRWQAYRVEFLKMNPLCVECLKDNTVEPATVVDHIKPHKGDRGLFWDCSNHQALCKQCHDKKTASEDGGWGNESK